MTRSVPSRQFPIYAPLAVLGLISFVHPATAAAGRTVLAPPPFGYIQAADNGVVVHEAWARASAGASTTGAAYVTLMGGAQPDSLIGASTPVAASATVHVSTNDNGVMKMRPAPAVPVPSGQMVTFSPNGSHIMLMGLKQPLTAGQTFPLTLMFAHAAPITVDVQVRGIGQAPPAANHDHKRM